MINSIVGFVLMLPSHDVGAEHDHDRARTAPHHADVAIRARPLSRSLGSRLRPRASKTRSSSERRRRAEAFASRGSEQNATGVRVLGDYRWSVRTLFITNDTTRTLTCSSRGRRGEGDVSFRCVVFRRWLCFCFALRAQGVAFLVVVRLVEGDIRLIEGRSGLRRIADADSSTWCSVHRRGDDSKPARVELDGPRRSSKARPGKRWRAWSSTYAKRSGRRPSDSRCRRRRG